MDTKQASGTENRPSRDRKQAFGTENRPSGQKTGLRRPARRFRGKGVHKGNMLNLFRRFGFHLSFSRADVMEVTGITATPATELMRKMKDAKLIESAEGRGKYRFFDSGE